MSGQEDVPNRNVSTKLFGAVPAANLKDDDGEGDYRDITVF